MLFDRSWYNRAGVERVMGFCTDEEYEEFLRVVPRVRARCSSAPGIVLVKYWFSVSDDEQERRFQDRISNPRKRWKLSPMDLESRARWVDYSRAKDAMFQLTDTKLSPWWVVTPTTSGGPGSTASATCSAWCPTRTSRRTKLTLPPRQPDDYVRPPEDEQTFVPEIY